MAAETGQSKSNTGTWHSILPRVIIYALLWLILSGHYDAFHLTLGALSIGLVLFINRADPGVLPPVSDPHHLRWVRMALYIPWLAKEMVLSAFHVARMVLQPKLSITPSLVRFRSEQPHDLAKVVLGNSITLTPGTLTIDIDGDDFLVHSLTDVSREGLLAGTMQRRVAALFGGAGQPVFDVRPDEDSRS